MKTSLRSISAVAVVSLVACRFMQPGMLAPRFDGQLVSVVPAPTTLVLRPSGTFVVGDSTAIEAAAPGDTTMRIAEMLAQIIRPSTGFVIPVRRIAGATAPRSISLRLDPSRTDVGPEGYALTLYCGVARASRRRNMVESTLGTRT